jgi:hypothetical protein
VRSGARGVSALISAFGPRLHAVAAAAATASQNLTRPAASGRVGRPRRPALRALVIWGVAPSPTLPFQRAPAARYRCRPLPWYVQGGTCWLDLPGLPAGCGW